MNGLTQPYLFKERLQKCEPIDLSHFVVDLRERHLDYSTPCSGMHPRERNIKLYLPSMVRPSYQEGPGHTVWHIRHTPFLDTCSLIFLVTLFAAWHASDFVPTPFKLKM